MRTANAVLIVYIKGEFMKIKPILEIEQFLAPIAESVGVRIVEVEFKQGKNPEMTVYIDKDGGVDLDTCEIFHRAIDLPIDELDPTFGQPYTLNVSSPGADRPFKSEQDFLSHIGQKVEVKLYASIRGKKSYDGVLTAYDGKTITLKVDEKQTFTIDLNSIVKVNEYIEF